MNRYTSPAESTPDSEARWAREVAFFDEEYHEEPLAEATLARYRELKRPWTQAEYPFAVLGDVSGLNVLELGCGDGSNAILLATRGARVLGLDVSPNAIAIATRRATLHGVADRVRFLCKPLELFTQENDETFDIICGWAVLHHILPMLDTVLTTLRKHAGPKTQFLFVEPTSELQWLRALRLRLPIRVHGTPDERPLNRGDLATINRHLSLSARPYYLLTRLLRPVLPANYETATTGRRRLYEICARTDNLLLSIPGIRACAGVTILHGRPAQS